MEEIFVTKVRINKVRHLENLEIPLSDTERKHLILTGKNGSGKTSVLEGIVTFLNWILNNPVSEQTVNDTVERYEKWKREYDVRKKRLAQRDIKIEEYSFSQSKSDQMFLWQFPPSTNPDRQYIEANVPVQLFSEIKNNKIYTGLYHSNDVGSINFSLSSGNFILKYFPSKRNFNPTESTGPQKIDLKDTYTINEDANTNFVKQLVNLRFDFLDSKDTGKNYEVEKIEKWFIKFETVLKAMFDDETLELVFDRPNFNYNIITKNHNPFNLNQLSDGFAAFLSIVTEIMMRMDKKFTSQNPYDLQGIVLIDEIETHLHIDLQKKILTFLTAFFPKIQFIVTTHSPFVLSSIDNAVIYDLEKQIRVEDLSDYKYHEIVDTYFETNQYSDFVEKQVAKYESLIAKTQLTENEEEDLYKLRKYFRKLPFFLSPELQLKIQSLELYPQNTPA